MRIACRCYNLLWTQTEQNETGVSCVPLVKPSHGNTCQYLFLNIARSKN